MSTGLLRDLLCCVRGTYTDEDRASPAERLDRLQVNQLMALCSGKCLRAAPLGSPEDRVPVVLSRRGDGNPHFAWVQNAYIFGHLVLSRFNSSQHYSPSLAGEAVWVAVEIDGGCLDGTLPLLLDRPSGCSGILFGEAAVKLPDLTGENRVKEIRLQFHRIYNASRQEIFTAWTESDQIMTSGCPSARLSKQSRRALGRPSWLNNILSAPDFSEKLDTYNPVK
jgi:hypothetical protein